MLYGTAISAQKIDDMAQTTNNSQLVNGNNNINSNNNNSRSKSSQTNKKQSQKASTLSPQSQGTTTVITRKNNGKQKNNNNNKNGKNNQRIASSSPTTSTSTTASTTNQRYNLTVTLNGGKEKLDKNQSKTMTVTTLPRVRPTAKLPKQQKTGSGNSNNDNVNSLTGSSKLDKYQSSYANNYEKISSGKAPKQVKEGSYTAAPRILPDNNGGVSGGVTPNPSMTKMFERYEKIQEIFPELEPYKEVNNPVFFTVSNGKPSRENSKSFSSFVSFDSMPQKKNTPDDVVEARQKIISSAAAASSSSLSNAVNRNVNEKGIE